MELHSPEGETYETPVEALCPLCTNEQTTLKENKAGKPYFQCENNKTTVNLNADDSDGFAAQFVNAAADPADDVTVSQPDTDESDDGTEKQNLADIIGGSDDE